MMSKDGEALERHLLKSKNWKVRIETVILSSEKLPQNLNKSVNIIPFKEDFLFNDLLIDDPECQSLICDDILSLVSTHGHTKKLTSNLTIYQAITHAIAHVIHFIMSLAGKTVPDHQTFLREKVFSHFDLTISLPSIAGTF